MSKFATAARPAVFSPVRSTTTLPDTLTAEGGAGFSREPKSELFLLAVTNMVAERTFYEDSSSRDARFEALIAQATKDDPAWIRRFVPYLRGTMNMRSAALVMAAEYAHAGGPAPRTVIASACQRADEPAEMLGYWLSRYGKKLPMPVKRGIADAATRLYNERAALKYDGDKAIRMGDVIELTHPKPSAPWQSALFEYLISKRHNRARLSTEALPAVTRRVLLEAVPRADRRAQIGVLEADGTTWEWASSWIGGKLDAAFWEAMIPNMGYMALLRNLRNFDEAGVSDLVAADVAHRLADADEVAKSRQLPLRFYSAYRAVRSLRWHWPLEQAINHSLANVPALKGCTLVMVDCSGSMDDALSAKSDLRRRDAASMFGAALALRAESVTLLAYADTGVAILAPKGGSVLPLAQSVSGATNGGTRTLDILAANHAGHDRVVILTDEQAFAPDGSFTGYFGGYGLRAEHRPDVAAIPCPIYTFNLAGYAAGHLPSGSRNRHTFGGLTDAGFTAIDLLERGENAEWPF